MNALLDVGNDLAIVDHAKEHPDLCVHIEGGEANGSVSIGCIQARAVT